MRRRLAPILATILRYWLALRNQRTPAWARGVVWGLLGYILWPLDLIPDLVPVVGWSDDLLALVAALLTLHWYSRGDIARRAADRAHQLLKLPPPPA